MPRRRSTTTPTRTNAPAELRRPDLGTAQGHQDKTPTYEVRWIVAGKAFSRTLPPGQPADNFRSELRAALNRGEGFDVSCGLPVSMLPDVREIRWWDWALEYVDLKWPTLAPTSRLSLAEALVSVTMALLPTEPAHRPAKQLRAAMQRLGVQQRRLAPRGRHRTGHAAAIAWLARNTRLLSDLEQARPGPRRAGRISRKLDGEPAGATTRRAQTDGVPQLPRPGRRTRAAHDQPARPGAVASVQEHRGRRPRHRRQPHPGPRPARRRPPACPAGNGYVAFFGLLYYAGARPSEAIALHWDDIQWPEREGDWGWLRLRRSKPPSPASGPTPDASAPPTQAPPRRDHPTRSLRPRPARTLRDHRSLASGADARVFSGPHGADLRDETYRRVWQAARDRALTPEQVASGLAKTPYTLRHACVSTWLAAGVDPTQVAAWAGHSVAVLLRVYAHVIDQGSSDALASINAAMMDRRHR